MALKHIGVASFSLVQIDPRALRSEPSERSCGCMMLDVWGMKTPRGARFWLMFNNGIDASLFLQHCVMRQLGTISCPNRLTDCPTDFFKGHQMRLFKFCAFTAPLALLVTSCASPTPYRPVTIGENQTGFSDYRIEQNRYRVSFSGNSYTSRDTVERYLLYRAAELTLEQGYDWFYMAERTTDRFTRTRIDRPFTSGAYGYWGPYWNYRSRRNGWRSWDPYSGDPFWDRDIDVRSIDNYEATAEIVLGRGRDTGNDRRTFNARDVIDNLRGSIRLPD
jgi:hypothetical protein